MKERILRRAGHVLGLGLLTYAAVYVWRHWSELADLLTGIQTSDLMWMAVLTIVQWLVRSLRDARFFAKLGHRVGFLTVFRIQNLQALINYAPLHAGTVYAAHRLKSSHGVPYSRIGAVFAAQMAAVSAAACLAAAVVLTFHPAIASLEGQILLLSLALAGLAGVAVFALPLPSGLWGWMPGRMALDRVYWGIRSFSGSPRLLVFAFSASLVSFLVGIARMGLAFRALGVPLGLPELIVLGATAHLSIYVSITPSGLGVREAVVGVTTLILGAPLATGVVAASVERAMVLFTLLGVVGTSAVPVAWRWFLRTKRSSC